MKRKFDLQLDYAVALVLVLTQCSAKVGASKEMAFRFLPRGVSMKAL